jgi:hypothetical protein
MKTIFNQHSSFKFCEMIFSSQKHFLDSQSAREDYLKQDSFINRIAFFTACENNFQPRIQHLDWESSSGYHYCPDS